ncbi:MAG: glycine--tRNA ligase subunit beta [Firmicutes bacterium]|nr:glycine--tRNA ligase subunit beta [Alicyclobacillaceae bacterium]MCL6496928.1 glycine--tRNA ligase subunit beta [Bacillota bacterium]
MDSVRFLWELGVEEIPSRYLDALTSDLMAQVTERLQVHRLEAGAVKAAATPRRLVLWGPVRAQQAEAREAVRGPQWRQAFTAEGEPTPALAGFLARVGADRSEVREAVVGGRTYAVVEVRKPVASAEAVLPQALAEALAAVPLPRSMRWGEGAYRFLRPVRWTQLWLEDRLVPWTVMGVESQPKTYGNRTDAPEAVPVAGIDHYWALLPTIRVMVSGEERRRHILAEARRLAAEVGGVLGESEDLLQEVANLVEWPTPFRGEFDPEFLAVPDVVLTTSMRVHQRYFPVYGEDGRLLPYFVAVRNGVGEDLEAVRRGNEKVLRARLNDAAYFYREDLRQPLAERAEGLHRVLFWEGVGSYRDKVERMTALARRVLPELGLEPAAEAWVVRAVALCKADLLSHVVQEFPELEGVMGGIYARAAGEAEEVAEAIAGHYLPRGADDPVPSSRWAQLLGLLDRVDTLVALLGRDIRPTGSEDPYGLRRAALGIGRILAEGALGPRLSLRALLAEAAAVAEVPATVADEAHDLIVGRLAYHWQDRWPSEWVMAAVAADDRLGSLPARLERLAAFRRDPGFEGWVTAAKRAARVLSQAAAEAAPEPVLPVEAELWAATAAATAAWSDRPEEWGRWWEAIPRLAQAVDRLFEAVLVLDPDPAVRARRLGLLRHARAALILPADPERL